MTTTSLFLDISQFKIILYVKLQTIILIARVSLVSAGKL